MELVLHISANLPREKFFAHYSYSKFFTAPDYHRKFPYLTRNPLQQAKFHFQARNTRNRTRKFVLLGKKQWLRGNEQEQGVEEEDEDEEEEEEEASSYSDNGSSFLSLSVKPDRNMSLLDDYEMEELVYESDLNHRSG